MIKIYLYALAFIGGVFLAVQAAYNAKLSNMIQNPFVALLVSSLVSSTLAVILVLTTSSQYNFDTKSYSEVPWYLWVLGGLFSCIGISLYFYTIPKTSLATVITLGLSGQIIFSIVSGANAWFGAPITLQWRHFLGVFLMILGTLLINKTN